MLPAMKLKRRGVSDPLWEKYQELMKEAQAEEDAAREALRVRDDKFVEMEKVMTEIRNRDLLGHPNASATSSNRRTISFPSPGVESPKRRGRPPGSKNSVRKIALDTPSSAPKRRGRPPGSRNKAASGTVGPTAQATAPSSEPTASAPAGSLARVIWTILKRTPKAWAKVLGDYPEGAAGLLVPEIRKLIEAEGHDANGGKALSTEIQSILATWRDEGIVDRKDRRYVPKPGASPLFE